MRTQKKLIQFFRFANTTIWKSPKILLNSRIFQGMQPFSTSTQESIKFYYEYEKYGEFSNYYNSPITLDGKYWPSTEHYYQAQKFTGTDEEYKEKVRLSSTPDEAKKLANAEGAPLRDDWEQIKYEVMIKALQAKFMQHENLKELLLSTGDIMLIENTTKDYVWGCGSDGTGKNWLGKALMEVREQLKNNK